MFLSNISLVIEGFVEWGNDDKKVFFKLDDLIEEIRKTPFEGKGKPEPLKHELKRFCGFAELNYLRTSNCLSCY